MTLKPLAQALALASAIALSTPAAAAFYVDDTTGGPTFTRALEDFSGLSAIGIDVAYDVYAFSVTTDGDYRIRSFAEGLRQDTPWDQFLFLYQGSFDPAQPLINGVVGNDDFGDIGRSGFDVALTAGTTYLLVTTGFDPEDQGRFLNLIRGPGEVMPVVPEPETYAMLAVGLCAVVLGVRRRRKDGDR